MWFELWNREFTFQNIVRPTDQNHNFFVCDMWNFGAKIQIVTSVSPEKNIIISEKEDSHDKIKGA